jgi:hypothetical protein
VSLCLCASLLYVCALTSIVQKSLALTSDLVGFVDDRLVYYPISFLSVFAEMGVDSGELQAVMEYSVESDPRFEHGTSIIDEDPSFDHRRSNVTWDRDSIDSEQLDHYQKILGAPTNQWDSLGSLAAQYRSGHGDMKETAATTQHRYHREQPSGGVSVAISDDMQLEQQKRRILSYAHQASACK